MTTPVHAGAADAAGVDGLGAFCEAAKDFAALAPHLWDPLAAATVAALDPRPGERVLDACCGTGASALPAARLVGPTGGVDAVDLAAPMVDLLRAEAERRGLAHLHAHVGDVTAWPGRGYDVVQCVMGIFFLPDMAIGTADLLARCRPGGRAGLTIWRRGAIEALATAVVEETCAVRGVPVPERQPHLLARVDEPEPHARWLRRLGLVHVQVAVAEMHLRLDADLIWLLVTGSGFRGTLSGLGAEDVQRVREKLVARLGGTVLDATSLVGTGTWPG